MQITSNLWRVLYADSKESFFCAIILFTFQWQHEKQFDVLCLGPGLLSLSQWINNKITINEYNDLKLLLYSNSGIVLGNTLIDIAQR